MTNRIVFSANALRISKPGYDVLTETNPNNLIVDGTYAGLGMYQTGTVVVSGNTKVTVAYSNPLGNIPFVMMQYARTSDAVGGGFYYESNTTSYIEDTIPASRVYETTPNSSVCIGLDYYVSTSNLYIYNRDTSARTIRYVIFYSRMAQSVSGTYDSVPDTMNWTDFSGTSSATVAFGGNAQTISGLGGPINLRVRVTSNLLSNQSIKAKVNNTYAATISPGSSSASFTVQNGDVVSFAYLGSAAFNSTVHVDNLTTGTNSIDTFNIIATAALDGQIETNWPNNSTTANSGGTSYLICDSVATVATINQTVTLTLSANAALGVNEVMQVYKTGYNGGNYIAVITQGQTSTSFTVVNGDEVRFRHAKYASSAAKNWTLYNSTIGAVSDTFNTTITDTYSAGPDSTPDSVNWTDLSEDITYGSAFPQAGTNTQTISGINVTVTIRLVANTSIPAGAFVQIYKNGGLVGTMGSGTSTYDFTWLYRNFKHIATMVLQREEFNGWK
jgi:hypothetical protein